MMPVKAKKSDSGSVVLKRLQEKTVEVEIESITPYIAGKWSEKAKQMMPGYPGAEKLKSPKGERQPEEEAEGRTYRMADGRAGIPATAFKAAMVGACRFFDGMTMTEAKLKFYVVGEGPDQLVPIEGTQALREDTPRNANGSADLRYRYEFRDWKAKLRISYLEGVIDEASIVALVDAAGRGGVGEWRPSAPKSATGTYGMFRVVGEEEE
jgi:hypothetical protein